MKALVTGAGGFCGRRLVHRLESDSVEVHTMGVGPGDRDGHSQISDVASVDEIAGVIRSIRPDRIFHLAGVAVSADPSLFYKVNIQYALALFGAMRGAGVDKKCPVLLVGTAAEYGAVEPHETPITEETTCRPYNHYGVSKLGQTIAGLNETGVRVVIARPFNIIGPGMPGHVALRSFADQIALIAKGGSPSNVIRTGALSPTRDFVDVDEVVDVYTRLADNSDAYGQVVNVCSGKGTAVSDALYKMIELAGLDVIVKTDPALVKPIDVPEHFGSDMKMRELAGRSLSSSLDDVLRRIVDDALGR